MTEIEEIEALAAEMLSLSIHVRDNGAPTAREFREWMSTFFEKLSALAARLREQESEDRRDAERYRWLREQHWDTATLFVVAGGKDRVSLGTDCPANDRLDAAIDAAIRESKAP